MPEDVEKAVIADSEVAFVQSTLRIVAAVLVGVGMVSMSLFVVTEPDVLMHLGLFLALLVANGVVAWLCLAKRWLPQGVLIGVLTATAVVAIALGAPVIGGQPFPLGVQLATLAATVTAVLLPFRVGPWVFIPLVIGTNAMIAARLLAASDGDFVSDALVVAADTLGICIGVAAALQVWRRLAQGRDAEAVQAARATANAEIARERSEYLRQLTYGLHDTVINTLGVVRRGIPPGSSQMVALRAADDLRQVDARLDGYDPDAQAITFADLPGLAGAQAQRLSLNAQIETVPPVDGDVAAAIPERVLRGMRECVNEALLNVSKYAPGTKSAVAIAIQDGELTVTVSDSGPRIPSRVDDAPTLLRRATASGIQMSTTGSSAGTIVEFRWISVAKDVLTDPAAPDAERAVTSSVAGMARRLGGWVGGGYLLASALSFFGDRNGAEAVPVLLGAIMVFAAVGASFWRFPIPTELVACMTAAIPVILFLETVGDGVCAAAGSTFPPSSWAALVAMMVILLSRQRWLGTTAVLVYGVANGVIVVMAMSGLTCGSAYLSNYLTDLAALVAVGLMRRRISRYFSDSAVDSRDTANAEAEVRALHAYTQALQLHNRVMLTRSRAILGDIAAQTVDPLDDTVRTMAGEEEQHLRSLLRIDPQLGLLADELIAAVEVGVAAGVLVDVTVINSAWGGINGPSATTIVQAGEVLSGLVAVCEPSARLRVTVDTRDPAWLAVVGDAEGLPADQAAVVCGECDLPIDVTALDRQTIVEFLPIEGL